MVNSIKTILSEHGISNAVIRERKNHAKAKRFHQRFEVRLDSAIGDSKLIELYRAIRELKIEISIIEPIEAEKENINEC